MSTAKAESTANGNKVDLGLLEEDDEFEEFPAEGLNSQLLLIFYPTPKKHIRLLKPKCL